MDLASLYSQEVDSVYAYFARFGLSPAEAEDATHDTFVTALQRVASFDAKRPARPWLLGIAFRVGVARSRHGQRREQPAEESVWASVQDPATSPEQSAATKQAEALLKRALALLPEEQRAVFILHDLQEVPMPEVAEIMGTSPNTAWSRLRLARASCNQLIDRLLKGEVRHA